MLLLLIAVLLMVGWGGYRLGGPEYGAYTCLLTMCVVLAVLSLLGVVSGEGLNLY